MRIIGGKLKGNKLKSPGLHKTRPSNSKTREAIFDILGERVLDARCLDLFSGTGALGIEALSRGAKEVIFVERDKRNKKVILENLKTLGLVDRTKVMGMDVERALKRLNKENLKFDLLFADPPYIRGLAEKFLRNLAACDILFSCALVVIEHHKKEELPEQLSQLVLHRKKRYGHTLLSIYGINETVKKIHPF